MFAGAYPELRTCWDWPEAVTVSGDILLDRHGRVSIHGSTGVLKANMDYKRERDPNEARICSGGVISSAAGGTRGLESM